MFGVRPCHVECPVDHVEHNEGEGEEEPGVQVRVVRLQRLDWTIAIYSGLFMIIKNQDGHGYSRTNWLGTLSALKIGTH